MNQTQKIILFIAAALVALASLFPPLIFAQEGGRHSGVGFGFLFDRKGEYSYHPSIDWTVLACEWGAVLIVAALLVLAFKAPER